MNFEVRLSNNNLVHESSFIYLVSIPPLSWRVFVCVDGNIRKEINNEKENIGCKETNLKASKNVRNVIFCATATKTLCIAIPM